MTRKVSSVVILVCAVAVARPATQRADVPEPKLLTNDGGRVSWYQGDRHDLIAFDAVVDKKTQNTELFVMSPDGSGRRCVSCDAATPQGFVGQPSWHPDGEHLVIQVENGNSEHKFYNHMSWGIDNDLWLITRDGKRAQKIWDTPKLGAALHPQFSPDGRMLVWAERVPTGKKLQGAILRKLAPGGENQWTGWRIHLANVDVSSGKLSNHRSITPNGEGGFYETHGIRNGRLIYSATKNGANYVDDVYEVPLDGGNPTNLTNSPDTWDEHGQYSAKGDLAFISSRVDKGLKFPGSRPANLRTELYVRQDGRVRPLTDMNQRKGKKVVVSDYDWDRDGRRIAVQVASIDASFTPEIWMLTVR